MQFVCRSSFSALSLASLCALSALSGCTDPGPGEEATGTVSINLVGQASSGAIYRLRDATIMVTGPTSVKFWNTEDDPSRTSLSANVVVGDYSALLQPGWRIERVEGMSRTTVPAELETVNPSLFTVSDSERTNVPLRFQVFGENVDMSQGYDIVLEIQECTPTEQVCGDGIDNDCDGATDCSDSDCALDVACAVCGDGLVQPGEACDDGNTSDFDGCDANCQPETVEVEPNEDGSPSTGGTGITGNDFATASADANGAITEEGLIVARISPAGDEDVFAIENPAANGFRVLRLDTWSAALGIGAPCGLGFDTGLTIRDAAGADLKHNDDRGPFQSPPDRCSGLDFVIAPGQRVYAHVVEFGDNAELPGYVLAVRFSQTCGNSSVDPGEMCDDGNTENGDGCSATCQLEPALELEPNGSTADAAASALQITGDRVIAGSIAAVGDQDYFQVTVPSPRVVHFETFTSQYDCAGASMQLRLRDAAGAQITSDTTGSGIAGCAALTYFFPAGTYYIQVNEFGDNEAIPAYYLLVDYGTDTGLELEPAGTSGANDTIATASTGLVLGNHITLAGDHTLAADVDVYSIKVPAGGRIRAEIIEGDTAIETCESNGIDSYLTLYDQSGVELARNDDAGRGFCSLIDGTGSVPEHPAARNPTTSTQTYYLSVKASSLASAAQAAFIYRLHVSVH